MSGSYNAHARLSPSSSKRWTTCTASIGYIEENSSRIRGDGSSVYSDEGTEAHDWAQKYLENTICYADLPVAFHPVYRYVRHCMDLKIEHPRAESFVEIEVPLFYEPDEVEKERDGKKVMERPTGTVDFALVTEGLVIIRDLKYGAGVEVHAEDNTQLAIYALSFVRSLQEDGLYEFGPDTVVDLGIVQPRYRGDEPVKTWVIALRDLEMFCEHIEDAVRIIHGDSEFEPKFEPSEDACKFCPAKAFCEARMADLAEPFHDVGGIDLLALLPDLTKEEKKLPVGERVLVGNMAMDLGYIGCVGDQTLANIYHKSKAIRAWLDDVEEYLSDRVVNGGESIEGLKVVMGREGNRKWTDEDEVERRVSRFLKLEERSNRTLKSPTQLLPLLEAKGNVPEKFIERVNDLVARSEARPVLAPATDKRPAIEPAIHALPDLTVDEDGLD